MFRGQGGQIEAARLASPPQAPAPPAAQNMAEGFTTTMQSGASGMGGGLGMDFNLMVSSIVQ